MSPFAEDEVCEANNNNAKCKTDTIKDNGLNPVFNNEVHWLDVVNPEMALLRFFLVKHYYRFDEDTQLAYF